MGQTTITVQDSTLERFKQLKEELEKNQPDCPNHTTDSFVNSLLDTWDAADEGMYDEETLSPGEFESKLKEHHTKVLNRLDDLQSQLPNDVAGELR